MTLRGALEAFLDDASVRGAFTPARAEAKVALEQRLARISRTSTTVLIAIFILEAAAIVFAGYLVLVASDRSAVLTAIGKVNLFNLPAAIATIAAFVNRKTSVDTVIAILPSLDPDQLIAVALALLSPGKADTPSKPAVTAEP